jgi:Glycosyl transferase family 2
MVPSPAPGPVHARTASHDPSGEEGPKVHVLGRKTWYRWLSVTPASSPPAPQRSRSPSIDRKEKDMKGVSVVIPALNEAKNLPHVLPLIPRDVHEVILVDGHSTDSTATVAREFAADDSSGAAGGTGQGLSSAHWVFSRGVARSTNVGGLVSFAHELLTAVKEQMSSPNRSPLSRRPNPGPLGWRQWIVCNGMNRVALRGIAEAKRTGRSTPRHQPATAACLSVSLSVLGSGVA